MHVVRDATMPYGDNASIGVAFDRTVLYTRDPHDALGSIMLENGRARSFDFRRLHILRATGHDIAAWRDALARAVASYVQWHRMAMALGPDAVIRVEDPAGVPDVIAALGLAQVAGTDPPDRMTPRQVNASTRKFAQAKPALDADSYTALDAGLRDALALLCHQLGYAVPWDAAADRLSGIEAEPPSMDA